MRGKSTGKRKLRKGERISTFGRLENELWVCHTPNLLFLVASICILWFLTNLFHLKLIQVFAIRQIQYISTTVATANGRENRDDNGAQENQQEKEKKIKGERARGSQHLEGGK